MLVKGASFQKLDAHRLKVTCGNVWTVRLRAIWTIASKFRLGASLNVKTAVIIEVCERHGIRHDGRLYARYGADATQDFFKKRGLPLFIGIARLALQVE